MKAHVRTGEAEMAEAWGEEGKRQAKMFAGQ